MTKRLVYSVLLLLIIHVGITQVLLLHTFLDEDSFKCLSLKKWTSVSHQKCISLTPVMKANLLLMCVVCFPGQGQLEERPCDEQTAGNLQSADQCARQLLGRKMCPKLA